MPRYVIADVSRVVPLEPSWRRAPSPGTSTNDRTPLGGPVAAQRPLSPVSLPDPTPQSPDTASIAATGRGVAVPGSSRTASRLNSAAPSPPSAGLMCPPSCCETTDSAAAVGATDRETALLPPTATASALASPDDADTDHPIVIVTTADGETGVVRRAFSKVSSRATPLNRDALLATNTNNSFALHSFGGARYIARREPSPGSLSASAPPVGSQPSPSVASRVGAASPVVQPFPAPHPFECAICFELWDQPVQLSPCDHVFCSACVTEETGDCPMCRAPVHRRGSLQDPTLSSYRKIGVRCLRCAWAGPRGEAELHECQASVAPTPLAGERSPLPDPDQPPQPGPWDEYGVPMQEYDDLMSHFILFDDNDDGFITAAEFAGLCDECDVADRAVALRVWHAAGQEESRNFDVVMWLVRDIRHGHVPPTPDSNDAAPPPRKEEQKCCVIS